MNPSPERLYYDDSYLRRFRATVAGTGSDPLSVVLDKTAFYPTSGGQPFDTGRIGSARVVDVVETEAGIRHVLDRAAAVGELECEIDWERRFDHMQQHTGQHLLSAVLAEVLGIPTVSFHLGADASTIDVETPRLEARQVADAEERANRAIFENRAVTVSYHDSGEDLGLRKPADREGTIRVVTIDALDRSACGGTHVRSTAEIGPLFIRKLDKVRGNVRVEFYCGHRALRLARTEREAALAAQTAQSERLAEAEKLARKLGAELAAARGRERHAALAPNSRGLRVEVRRLAKGPIGDELRIEAQAMTALGGAVFVALCADPPSILLCASPDSGIAAGAVVKPLLEAAGGRGGGNPQMAQGSAPSADALEAIWRQLEPLLGGA